MMENASMSSQDLPTFTFNAANLTEEWKAFSVNFHKYLISSGSENKPDAVKIATLLSLMGTQSLPVFNSFSFDKEVYLERVLKNFEDYFLPKSNVVVERFNFWSLSQQPEESIDEYVTKLRTKAETCRFKDQTDEMIRDRVLQGCADRSLVEIFIQEDDLTLDKALQICRTAESLKAAERTPIADESRLTACTIDPSLTDSDTPEFQVKQERRSDSYLELRAAAVSLPNITAPLGNITFGETIKRSRGRPRIRPIVPIKDGEIKRGRGRPRIHPVSQPPLDENGEVVKRGRGRPRIHPEREEWDSDESIKRGRGRPRKIPRLEDGLDPFE